MKKNTVFSLLIGGGLSAIALWLAFRNVPLSELAIYVRSVNYFWMIPAIVLTFLSLVLRAVRWREIVSASYPIGILQAYHPVAIGFMLNYVLPARAGEIARPLILQKQDDVPFSTGLATVAAERVFDLIFLIILLAWALSSIRIDPGIRMSFGNYHLNKELLEKLADGMFRMLIVLIVGMVLFIVPYVRSQMIRVLGKIPNLFSESLRPGIGKVCTMMSEMIENIASGFVLVRHPRRIYACIAYTLLIWTIQVFSYHLVVLGCPGVKLSLTQTGAMMVMICFFVALPSVPGFWGIWEAGGIFALSLFGVSGKEAAGYTLVNHAIQILPLIPVGLASVIALGMNIRQLSYKDA